MKDIIAKLERYNKLAKGLDEIYLNVFDDGSVTVIGAIHDEVIKLLPNMIELSFYLDKEIKELHKYQSGIQNI